MTAEEVGVGCAAVARKLLAESDEQQTLDTGLALTVDMIECCHHAGITITHRDGFDTVAATSDLVRRGDELQYQLMEGPCIDSLRQQQPVTSPDLAQDARWPSWGPAVVDELGVASIMSFQLFTQAQSLGALNLYSERIGSFDHNVQAIGTTMAAQIAVALQATREITTRDQAISTRTVIGQAQGILMERYNLTDDTSFQMLKSVSQNTNTKLVVVAARLVRDRRLPS